MAVHQMIEGTGPVAGQVSSDTVRLLECGEAGTLHIEEVVIRVVCVHQCASMKPET